MKRNLYLLIVFCIALPLFLTLFSFKYFVSFGDYNDEQKLTIDYLRDKADLIQDYPTNEKEHLQDVKRLMIEVNYIFYLLLLVLIIVVALQMKRRKELKKMFLYGGIATVSFVALVVLSMLINFEWTFRAFHGIFFPQGNWMFLPDSLIIKTFPEKFFVWTSVKIFINSFTLGLISIFVSFAIRMKKK